MKTNVLRAPLIKSAVVLVIFSLLFYFTSTSPQGSVWASIGTIFIVIFTTIQWAVALAIGLVVSLAVLIGIFLGAVAMFSQTSASRMYEGLQQTLLSWFTPIINLFKSDREEKMTAALAAFGQEMKVDFSAEIQAARNGLKKTQAELETKLSGLSARLAALEEKTEGLAREEQLETLAAEIKEAAEAAAGIKGTVDTLSGKLEQTAQQLQETSGDAVLGDLPARIEALEQQEIPELPAPVDIAPLAEEITTVKAQLATLQKTVTEAAAVAKAGAKVDDSPAAAAEKPVAKKPKKAASKPTKDATAEQEEHRIFSYFKDPADKKKVADLVASTLKKDMSYKQVMELVAKGLGGGKGKIITSHPSLSKDYIRQCRKKS